MRAFKELTKAQAELDNHIALEKSIYMPDKIIERVIALQVEFNELLNEIPHIFKYWSNKKMNREKALEEYVDGLHFLLSIANDLGIKDYEYQQPKTYDLRVLVLGINNMISRLPQSKDFKQLMDHYWLFGQQLNFTEDEIVQAYYSKNEVNHARQVEGY